MTDSLRTPLGINDAKMQEAELARKELAAVDREHQATQVELEKANASLGQAQAKLKKTEADLATTKGDLVATRTHAENLAQMLEALKARRSVRYVLAGVDRGSGLRRLTQRGDNTAQVAIPATSTEVEKVDETSAAPSQNEPSPVVTRLLSERADAHPSTEGPLVTIVIITRNGIHHMRRVLDGLSKRTSYESFEVVVVDNDSSDDTVALCRQDWPFDLRVIENDTNRSFSEANNQARPLANGDYVLFLNNDVDPINPGWLGAMVDAVEADPSRGAAGALLIYPEYGGKVRPHAKPLTVQHRGIRFRYEDDVPKGYNVGHGEDPLTTPADGVVSFPGVTAACMLVRSKLLAEVGWFTEGYVYGTEDVDLSLKIRNAGKELVVVAGAALFHHEFGTQDELSQRIKRINRNWNRTLFLETWGPTLERLMTAEARETDRFWSADGTPTVAITTPKDDEQSRWADFNTANELREAMADLGWKVVLAEQFADRWYELDEPIDLAISLFPECDPRRLAASTTLALVRNSVDRWTAQPWFEDYDVVAVSTEETARLITERSRHHPVIVPLATNPDRFTPQPRNVTYASDLAFTGNDWGAANRSVPNVLPLRPDEKFVMFGTGWDAVPRVQRYWRGPAVYDDLATIYSSAKVVLDRTETSTASCGTVNARVLDALASGTLVVSDNVNGGQSIFDGKLPTYTTRDELRAQLDKFLGDEELRQQTVDELRSVVLERHTYPKLAHELTEVTRVHGEQPRVRIKIGPPNWEIAEQWGDTHFARHFASALNGQGFRTEIDVLAEWDAPQAQDAEVVVHLRGLMPYVPKRSQINVLWIISHPDDVSQAECDAYDVVLVASPTFAEQLRERTSTPVVTMLQATSPRMFQEREPDADLATDLLFVGNSRGVMRPAVEMALEKGLPLRVYGSGWTDLIPAEHVVGEYFPNERLSELYSSAKLLVNDHWEDMRELGFPSNRLFDAFACGTVVVTDDVRGLDTILPFKVPRFDDADSLAEVVQKYLADDALRASVGQQGQAVVLEHHTFDQRARMFKDLVQPLLTKRRAAMHL